MDWHRQEEAKHEKNTGRVKVVRKKLVLVEEADHKELDPEEEVARAKRLKKAGQPALRLGRQLDLHAPAQVTQKQGIVQPTA